MQIQKSLDLNNPPREVSNLQNTRSHHPPREVSNLQNTRSHHPPRKGGSNGLMPFGEGAKDLNISSNLNFTENNSYPSPKSQILGSSTLPQGEGDKIEEGDGIENYSKKTLNFAKELRKSQTNAEGLLWYYLKNKQLGGYKFKRQQPIDKYIVDFVCFEKKLIIELDGSQHNEDKNIKHDKIRDSFLRSLGFTILRFWNDEIFTNCFNILDFILHKLENPLDLNNPPRKGGSNGLMPFGEGAKNLNISSNLNFAKNNSYPSPKSQILGSSTLPSKKILGEGDLDRENNSYPSPKSQILGSSTLPSKKILGEGDEDRENTISPSPNLQANSTLQKSGRVMKIEKIIL